MPRKQGDPNFNKSDKAQAVAILETEARGNYSLAERLTGIGRNTIRTAAKDPEITQLAVIKKEELALKLNSLLGKLIDRYDSQVEDADLSNRGVSLLGIVADKALLYANQPNQITATIDINAHLESLKAKGFSDEDAQLIVEEAQKQLEG